MITHKYIDKNGAIRIMTLYKESNGYAIRCNCKRGEDIQRFNKIQGLKNYLINNRNMEESIVVKLINAIQSEEPQKQKMNFEMQYYKGIPLKLIDRQYKYHKAKRYAVNNTNQNFWIPNCYLEDDGTIKQNMNLDFIFKSKTGLHKLELAKVYLRRKYERD